MSYVSVTRGAISSTVAGCACCGAPSSVFIRSRVAPGTARLCAWPEFPDHLSSPPKSYKILAAEGQFYNCNLDAFCVGPDCLFVTLFDWSSVLDSVYDIDCNITTETWVRRFSHGQSACAPVSPGTDSNVNYAMEQQPFGFFTLPLPTGWIATSTATTYQLDGDGIIRGPSNTVAYGTILQTLSDEYTEDDAIARIVPTLVYGGWSVYPSPDTYVSRWEIRTAGYTFTYDLAQFEIFEDSLTPFTSYDYDVNFWRRPFGSGTFVDFATATFTGTTNALGEMILVGDIPIDRGFETWAKGAVRLP